MTNHTWLGLKKIYIICCSIIHLQTPSATSFIEQDAEKNHTLYTGITPTIYIELVVIVHHLYSVPYVAQLVTHLNCRAAGSIPAGGSIVVFFTTALGLKFSWSVQLSIYKQLHPN
jgi:hypothetical protein